MKTFTFAGTCTENGATVYKFANDASRAKALERFGCTNVNMIELPAAMAKEAAVTYLAQVGMTAAKAPRVAKSATVAKVAKVAKTATVAKVAKVAKTATVVKVAKRVGDKPRKNQSPEDFAIAWFADKEARVNAKFGF
jgi:hypothetical protein